MEDDRKSLIEWARSLMYFPLHDLPSPVTVGVPEMEVVSYLRV